MTVASLKPPRSKKETANIYGSSFAENHGSSTGVYDMHDQPNAEIGACI